MWRSRHCTPDSRNSPFCATSAALEKADALLIVTEWKEFRSPDFDSMKQKLNSPVVFEGRNLFEPVEMRRLGFVYFGIGR